MRWATSTRKDPEGEPGTNAVAYQVNQLLDRQMRNQFVRKVCLLVMIMLAVTGIYIIYDLQLIVGGKHRQFEFSVDDWAIATLCLYTDIIHLFIRILRLVAFAQHDGLFANAREVVHHKRVHDVHGLRTDGHAAVGVFQNLVDVGRIAPLHRRRLRPALLAVARNLALELLITLLHCAEDELRTFSRLK
uniref:Uncharacterized protein LOC113795286 n=1 Tax=Dermatophagoides pteronyssinus TaxID=6956 RepID=A0A6P6Y7A7_DERPT|nr:uncharacterized protein LOC113795286 [Dermatophagoides pteronyssinus]